MVLLLVEGLVEDADEGQASSGVKDAEEARDALQAMGRNGRRGTLLRPLPLPVDVLRGRVYWDSSGTGAKYAISIAGVRCRVLCGYSPIGSIQMAMSSCSTVRLAGARWSLAFSLAGDGS